jgi:hypothetical protein
LKPAQRQPEAEIWYQNRSIDADLSQGQFKPLLTRLVRVLYLLRHLQYRYLIIILIAIASTAHWYF